MSLLTRHDPVTVGAVGVASLFACVTSVRPRFEISVRTIQFSEGLTSCVVRVDYYVSVRHLSTCVGM